jgi:hypothetical protein
MEAARLAARVFVPIHQRRHNPIRGMISRRKLESSDPTTRS